MFRESCAYRTDALQCPITNIFQRKLSDFLLVGFSIWELPYSLAHRLMVFYAVTLHGDMIGRRLLLKGGLVTRCGALISSNIDAARTPMAVSFQPVNLIATRLTAVHLILLETIDVVRLHYKCGDVVDDTRQRLASA
jgi:hypothetical protein